MRTKKQTDNDIYHKDEYIKVKTWLYKNYPEIADEYEEESKEGRMIHT